MIWVYILQLKETEIFAKRSMVWLVAPVNGLHWNLLNGNILGNILGNQRRIYDNVHAQIAIELKQTSEELFETL